MTAQKHVRKISQKIAYRLAHFDFVAFSVFGYLWDLGEKYSNAPLPAPPSSSIESIDMQFAASSNCRSLAIGGKALPP